MVERDPSEKAREAWGQERQGDGAKESRSSDESDSGEPEWEVWGRIPVFAMPPVVPQTDFRVQCHFSWKGGTYGFNESVRLESQEVS